MKRKSLAVAITAAILAGSAAPSAPAAPRKSVLSVRALANGDAELLIYGFIGDYFYSESNIASDIVQRLANITAGTIQVRINSQGGSVPDGLAIYNALKRHPARIVMTVDGQAMSIASLVVQAGDERIMGRGAMMMVHAPSADVGGNANDLRQFAETLDTWAKSMLAVYTARVPKQADALSAMLTDGQDYYFTAAEAVDFGLADTLQDIDAEDPDESAVAAALLGYLDAVARAADYGAPMQAVASLRRHIQDAAQPHLFASLPEATQRAVYAHIEDSTMRQKYSQIMAAAAGAPPAPRQSDAPAGAAAQGSAAIDVIRARNEMIIGIAEPYKARAGVQAYVLSALADPDVSLDDFRQHMLTLIGRDSSPSGSGHIEFGNGGNDFVAAASDALAIRAGIKIAKPHPGARDIQGMALSDIMRVCANRSGRILDIGSQSKNAVVRAAMSTSDFPAILENTLGKTLRAGFEAEPSTFEAWTRKVTVPDFKPQSRVILGSAPELELVPEGGEYKSGSMDEDKSVPYSVGKYGKIVAFTWESLINDDLSAFLRTTQAMGQAAARKEADAIYATFVENAGAGPAMQDGKNLFSADHSNLATSAADITADALSAARVLLRRQTAVGGGVMNITPRFLLVAPENEQAAETLLAAAARSLSQGADMSLVPRWLAQLQLVVEARLDDSAFYLLAEPTNVDTLERAWLEADNGPVVLEEDSFGVDARRYKVRHVFAQRWLDWRGAVKVPLS